MSFWKRVLWALIFPHLAIVIALIPIAAVLLIYAFAFADGEGIISYISYAVSAYALTVVCFRIPWGIRFFKKIKTENKLIKRAFDDAHFRVKVSLYFSFYFNVAYALFQLGLALYHSSVWFYALAAYYLLLAFMRMYLLGFVRSNAHGVLLEREFKKYRTCGIVMLILNVALSVMITYMVIDGLPTEYNEIVAITMAAYTFTTLTIGIVNVFGYRKYNSPVFSASKDINLASAVVSVMTLESAMLSTFSDGSMDERTTLIVTASTGVAVMAFVLWLAIFMIIRSSKGLKKIRTARENCRSEDNK